MILSVPTGLCYRGEESRVGFISRFAQEEKGQLAGMIIAPHGAFAVGNLLASSNVVPTIGTMIDRMQYQALVFGVG